MANPEQPIAPGAISPEDQQKAAEVAQAGAQAAVDSRMQGDSPEQATEVAREAMHDRAQEVKLDLSEEQLNEIADKMGAALVTGVLSGMEARGVFEPPTEPVQPPAPDNAPPEPTVVEQEGPPRKPSFAERFLGRP